MIIRLYVVAALLAFCSAATAQDVDVDVTGFDRVVVADGVIAKIFIGDEFKVTTRSIENDRYTWDIALSDGQLQVGLDVRPDGSPIDFSDRYKITITMPELKEVTAQAGVHLDILAEELASITIEAQSGASIWIRNAEVVDVILRASSGASIEATGECGSLYAHADAGGFVDADKLECVTVQAAANGGSAIRYSASEAGRVEAHSGSRVVGLGEGLLSSVSVTGGSSFSIR